MEGKKMTSNSMFVTVKELAALLKIHYHQALQLVKSGEIPYVKIGRSYRIPAVQVEKLLQTDRPIILKTDNGIDIERNDEK